MTVIFFITHAGKLESLDANQISNQDTKSTHFSLLKNLIFVLLWRKSCYKGAILDMKDLVHAFKSRMVHCADDRSYTRHRKLIKNYLTSAIPTIQIQNSTTNIHCQRIISKDLQSLALHLAIKSPHDDNEFRVLRCTAKYQRDCVSKHMKNNKITFTAFLKHWNDTLDSMLTSFIRWILAGEVSKSTCSISSNMLYHFKTDRQNNYMSDDPENSKFYKPQRSIHHIALGFAMCQFHRDKKTPRNAQCTLAWDFNSICKYHSLGDCHCKCYHTAHVK